MYLPPWPQRSPHKHDAGILTMTALKEGGAGEKRENTEFLTSRRMDEGARTFRSYESSSSYGTLRATGVGRYSRGGEIYSDLQSPVSRRVTVLIWLLFPTAVRGIGAGRIKSAASPRWITSRMKNLIALLLDRDTTARAKCKEIKGKRLMSREI